MGFRDLAVRCCWLAILVLGGCFSPTFNDGAIQCGSGADQCPPGLACVGGVCRASSQPIDAAIDTPASVTLTLTRTGAGSGGATSVPSGVDCGATCTATFPIGTMVTLTAAPVAGSTFASWGGACSGASTTCTVMLTANTTVTADFGRVMHTVTVVSGGNGAGTVSSNPTGVNCPGTCTLTSVTGTVVTLSALATTGSSFVGWSGGTCSGMGTCLITLDADVTINASFALDLSVVVTETGTGTGTVTSSPGGINCPGDCSEAYALNTVVTLTATPAADSDFVGWTGGGCGGLGTCQVTVSAAVGISAQFMLKQYLLTVIPSGNGTGTITSSPGGITCPGDCTENYTTGQVVTLTAAPGIGSMFTGWSGVAGCPGTAPCTVTISVATNVAATFTLSSFGLTVMPGGNGSGTVTSGDGGINCGVDCTEPYQFNTMVTLTATANTGSKFTGWSGACAGFGTNPCTITIMAATNVTATFTLTIHTLTTSIAATSTGTGTITSAPIGINCGIDCSEPYNYGTMVTLTATPAPGSSFSGWSGACSGNMPCVLTITAAASAVATFTLNSYVLTVMKTGMGTGTVTSAPGGITCGIDCMEPYLYNTMVTLTAAPLGNSSFTGWSGPCSGTGTCIVTVTAATTVFANFSPPPNRMFVTSATYTAGMIGSLANADALCQAAAQTPVPPLPGTYRAYLSSAAVDAHTRLGLASGWLRTDGKPFANTKGELEGGKLYSPPRMTETGVDIGDVSVITATSSGGLYSGNGDCSGYTSTLGTATNGISTGGSSMFENYGSASCASSTNHLYCFGIDNAAVVVPPAVANVRRAFMRLWTPGGGLAGADMACQADATAAGLTGNFKALLAAPNASALSRFNLGGLPWARTDNMITLPTAAAWQTAAFFDTGPNLTADKTTNWGNYANWVGASTLTGPGTMASTCSGWTDTTATGFYGIAGNTRLTAFAGSSNIVCSFNSATITCLEL